MKLQTPTKILEVRDFNELLSCQLCGGYLINPTTVDNCLHTYCRSCIVQHLQRETCCPQCKITGGSKQINVTNLKSDDVLRALIFKLIPGLYQKERERTIQFKGTLQNGQQSKGAGDAEDVCSVVGQEQDITEENFFAPTEPISLSLEYHPALLRGCSTSQIPPVRYLQCPAGLKIRHLKRFLCSKFDIDPESKRIEVEVIYEDEVLPNDFTLMDVGYCYNWKRHAPMKFTYRILFYGDDSQKHDKDHKASDIEVKQNKATNAVKAIGIEQQKDMTLCDETSITTLTPHTSLPTNLNSGTPTALQKSDKSKNKIFKTKKVTTNKIPSNSLSEEIIPPVKMIIARKSSADSGKKPSPKHSNSEEVTYTVTNDFKSLRSNDMRYSDYAVSSTTSNSNSPKSSPKSAQRFPKSGDAATIVDSPATQAVVSKCDIVVSIPQSQMPKSPYAVDDEFENVSLAQLKTASKKSPPTAATTTVLEAPKSATTRNVPKLKIELNSLKTRLSISKPKSAGVLQGVETTTEKRERVKQRKLSLDEVPAPLTDHLDLETYAKNIGLQPIEVLTPPESAECAEKLKYSPNASPLSSASSTTSSSNNAFPLGGASIELTTTTSFHKKRKKKHSRDSKDVKEGKRRRMHAEISSKPEEESLKMKVKLTPSHTHKSHRSDNSSARKNSEEARKSHTTEAKDIVAFSQTQTEIDNILALNKTLGEESRSINHLMRENEKAKDAVQVVKADETLLTLPHTNLLPKSVNNIKDTKLPASPPLPPSLFKTTPLSFNTLTVSSTTAAPTKQAPNVGKQSEMTKTKQLLPATAKPATNPQYSRQGSLNATATKAHPNFIVPSLPRRPTPGTNNSYTPSSIASSSNQKLGLQLKRSASLDESYAIAVRGKQPKLDAAQRKSLYSSYANKPFTPSTKVGASKIADTVTNVQNSGGSTNSGLTITARPPANAAQLQSHWQLPPYTPLHLPYNKPAVEIVRINSNQTAVDIQLQPAANNATKCAGRMGPPLSMIKGKKANTQQSAALSSTGATVKTSPIAVNATSLAQSRNNTYRVSPPALVNLQGPTISSVAKKVSADTAAKKPEIADKPNGNATPKPIQQRRNSLRDFRLIRDHSTEIVDITGSKDEVRPADTTTSTAPSARESLEAALNKIKQNITSTTAQDNVAATAARQQQQSSSSTEMGNEDLQNLHLLSESATSREKITIRASQTYEKPKIQQQTLVRQQNASVRNIPNPSALAFRNMSTLPAVASSTTVTSTHTSGSNSTTTAKTPTTLTPAVSTPTQQKSPLTTVAAPLSPGNVLHSTTATTTTSASNNATSSTTTATRTVKKPTTIDQVAANLNMRASAAAAEAHAAKVLASEDPAQISSSTCISATAHNKTNELTKSKTKTSSSGPQNMASSTTTTNVPSVTTGAPAAAEKIERARAQQANKALKANDSDEGLKAKVLPKSIGDSGVTTTIVTDVSSIKNATNNNNNNNNNNSNNNNNNNSKNNNGNGKLGATAASVTSD